jgi:IS4 transposase
MGKKKRKQKGDLVIEHMNKLFPPELLRKIAKETGFLKRERKIDPVVMFWALVLGFGVHLERSLVGLKRRYEKETAKELSSSSWYDRFTPELVEFLHRCVLHGIELQAQQPGRMLKERLQGFKDLIIQDSSIVRVHASLMYKWPAARSSKAAAGVKVSAVVSAVVDGVHSVRLLAERVAEVKTLRIGPWVKDRILLLDLGFFKYGVFDRIQENGGYFVSRLMNGANPLIVGVNQTWRGRSIPVVGEHLKDVLPRLKRKILDVLVEVEFKRQEYRGKRSHAKQRFRLVAVYNEEDRKYHVYLTNIGVDRLSAEEIALLYRARWEVELLFKELKSKYCLDLIPSAKPEIVEAFIWIGILTLLCSRRIFLLVRAANPEKATRFTHMRWAKVFAENAPDLMRDVIRSNGLRYDLMVYLEIFSSQACDPNVKRERLMEGWVA